MPSATLRLWGLLVFALATVPVVASAARAEGATPLRQCTAEENPPGTSGDTWEPPCANNTGSDSMGVRHVRFVHQITGAGIFTPGADLTQIVDITIVPLSIPGGIGSFRPDWRPCFGDACDQGPFVPNSAYMRSREGTEPFAGVFRRDAAYGWRMRQVAGQASNCSGQLSCQYELLFTNGFSDADGNFFPSLAKDQQVLVDIAHGVLSLAFNKRVGGPPPVARFSVTELGQRTFKFDASASTGTIVKYEWDFGDGETQETFDPVVEHTYKFPGRYVASLRVIDLDNIRSVRASKEIDLKGILVNSSADRPPLDAAMGCDTGEDVAGGFPECTLRAAISALNAGVADTIEFALPADAGPIEPGSDLPAITAAGATVDGATQPMGAVVLSGRGLNVVGADHVTIRGLTILGGQTALTFSKSPDGVSAGNRIGIATDGSFAGGKRGIDVLGSARVRIGGMGDDRNVIAASQFGILVVGTAGFASDDVEIHRNLIGVDAADQPRGAGLVGILGVGDTASAVVAQRLVISDNTIAGFAHNVLLIGAHLGGASVLGNRIGTNAAGTATIGTPSHNIRIDDVPNATVRDNLVGGADWDVTIAGSQQTSVESTGDESHLEFAEPGYELFDSPRNGVKVVVAGNRVGLATPRRVGNTAGISVFAGAIDTTVESNVVAGHGVHEIGAVGTKSAVIRDNTLGIDAPSASIGVRVEDGDTVAIRSNLIGSVKTGLSLQGASLIASGNIIGVGADGATAKPVTDGIVVFPGPGGVQIEENTVANGATTGLKLAGTDVTAVKNKIGLTHFGAMPAPNAIGVHVLGGTATLRDNTIAHSGLVGVKVASSGKATLRSNAIYATSSTVGIEGGPVAPAVNGAARVTSGTSTRTWLVLGGLPGTGAGLIEVFGNPSCTDPEGKVPLFTKAPEAGRSTRVLNVIGRPGLDGLTVTYTDADGKTSHFSNCATAATMPDGDGDGIPDVVEAAGPVPTEGTAEVATVVNDADQWIALVAPRGTSIADFRLLDDPDPAGHPGKVFPIGFFTFTVNFVPLGFVSTVSLVLPLSVNPSAWWKHGPQTPGAASTFWHFAPDQATGTGATVTTGDFPGFGRSRLVHLAIADGGRGDEDFSENAVLRDPGAPAVCTDDDTPEAVDCRLAALRASLDAFQCYAAKAPVKFTPVLGVRANGPLDDVLLDVKKPLALCAPTKTTPAGVVDPETHLEVYAVKTQKGTKTVPRTGLRVVSQLGTLRIDTAKLGQLLLPTAEDPTTSPSLSVNEVDRFSCYAAKLAKGEPKLAKDLQVTVADQFSDPPKRVHVKKLVRFCTPVGVNDSSPKQQNGHLVCVKVVAAKGRCDEAAPTNPNGACKAEPDCGGTKGQTTFCAVQPKFVKRPGRFVVNDLDAGTLDVTKPDVLCLPALLEP